VEEEKGTAAQANNVSVDGSLDTDTQESIDSGISKDLLNTDDTQSIRLKEEKNSNVDLEMLSQKSSHSSPTSTGANAPAKVNFENEQQLDDTSENSDAVNKKSDVFDVDSVLRKQGEEIKKQDSLDHDSFVDIDVKTIDGALTAIVSDHLPSDTNVVEEDNVIDPTETMTVDAEPDDHNNKTLVKEEDNDGGDIVKDDIESELLKSLDATSRKNVSMNWSMEMARENLIQIEPDDASTNDSFYSAQSDITITDDTDNASSFMTANDRLTPINDEFSVSIPNLSSASPYSPKAKLSKKASSPPSQAAKSNKKNGSKFEIQFIDEKTHKVVSRESLLTASFDAKQAKKQKRMSAPVSPGRETTV